MNPHERAAGRFAERVQQRQALRGLGRALGIAAGQRLRHQAGERPLEQLTQASAFHQQPILEGGIADRDAVEEIAR